MAKIYISSTFSDLEPFRERVYRALRQLGHDVIAMEDYVATDARPLKKCLDDVERCDLYLGIFAWRYGYVPEKMDNPEEKSITELEFRHARRSGIDCTCFLLNEKARWPASKRDTGTALDRIRSFRDELSRDLTISFFSNKEQLAAAVTTAVTKWEKDHAQQTASRYRVIGFDLDGTLLRGLEFSWTAVWDYLGFPPAVRKAGMRRYITRKTTYAEWCEWACRQFRQRGLNRGQFAEITKPFTLTKNLREAISILRGDGFVTGIISGGIDVFLHEKIPDAKELFDYVFINELLFDEDGVISGVNSTPYDFEGKAQALRRMCVEHNYTMKEAVFVGEGFNDGTVVAEAGLSIAYPPREQTIKAAAGVEVGEDDLMKIIPHVMTL